MAPDVSAPEVAMSLQTAAHLERCVTGVTAVGRAGLDGPRSNDAVPLPPHGAGDPPGARLGPLTGSLLVSYAVYRIPNVRDALVRAARRGVRIEVIVETPDRIEGQREYSTIRPWARTWRPAPRSTSGPGTAGAGTNGKVGILHVKCVVADGRWLFLSSANLTEYAFTINMELGVLITGGEHPGSWNDNSSS